MDIDIPIKIIVAGDGGVGKTTLLHYYINREFLENTEMTIGVQFFPKVIEIDNKKYKIMFWDVGGQNRFRKFHIPIIGGIMGGIFMFDLTKISTLLNIGEWMEILRSDDKEVPILLVGSKYDVIQEDNDKNKIKDINDYALEMKEEYNLFDYIITSSKIGFNIDNTFKILLDKVRNSHKLKDIMDSLSQKRS